MRIYFADDSEDEREIMEATLSSGGYEDIQLLNSGGELLARLGIDPVSPAVAEPSLILLDIRMPGVDGVEACARIRADSRYQHTPILMVSSIDDLETLNHAFLAGANDYINKPYNRVELLARVRAAMRLKSELDRRVARERELLAARELRATRLRDAGSAIDPATNLLPREVLEDYVSVEENAALARIGVFALQIDSLDVFERNCGIIAKRDMLRQVAGALMHIPAHLGDLLTHFDTGLFLALLHNTDRAAMTATAQLTQRAVRALAVPRSPGSSEIVTASIGVALNREPRALLSAAVSAMGLAAREGDRIHFA
jgi:PleD family two-component response regulator